LAIRRSALPARRVRLIGRQQELEDLRDRILHGDRRLVTLTGAGGSGKTTLAIEASRLVEPAMPDGAWFVDLSSIHDADAAALALSDASGIIDQGDRPLLDALADHLAVRQTLVVLDNCEQLLPAFAETVDALLDACPDLRIFATSRVPLRIPGESIFAVPPFAVPEDGIDGKDLGLLSRVPAVDLFIERASATNPSFAMSSSTAPAVASICRRLDGLPLAIELAAAQTAVLTPVEIDERLGSTGGLGPSSRRGPARQRTMEATLDWSHDLLRPAEQAVFRRMSVFVGGWTLEAAEQVCSLGDDPATVVASLATLIEHSLVVRDSHAERSRYRMLTPIAEYATRRLAASGEGAAVGMAHAMYYVALTTRDDELGVNAPEDLDIVSVEHENCLAAIRFAEASGLMPLRLVLIRNLLLLWRVRGYIRLGTRHMEAALETVDAGSYEQGMLLGVLADYQILLGEYDVAEQRARAAEAIFETLGDPVARRTAMGEVGMVAAARGDFATALAEYQRAKPLIDLVPSDVGLAYWHAGVGRFELGLGDLDAARRDLELAHDHFSRTRSWTDAQVLSELGVIARRTGDPARAEALLGDALGVLRAYGATVEAIECLEDVARVALEKHEWRRAATLFAATTGLRDATAATPNRSSKAQLDADIDRVRSMLDAQAFEAAWVRGLGLTLDEAAEVAMAAPDVVAAADPAPRGSVLTAREREIADLVALGLTNPQIAERLVISTGTVRIHVERILGKLGRTSRVQVATWVMDQREKSVI
jgi:predicted ATPase/DNA-binding CsgD family transcriptional regulator